MTQFKLTFYQIKSDRVALELEDIFLKLFKFWTAAKASTKMSTVKGNKASSLRKASQAKINYKQREMKKLDIDNKQMEWRLHQLKQTMEKEKKDRRYYYILWKINLYFFLMVLCLSLDFFNFRFGRIKCYRQLNKTKSK